MTSPRHVNVLVGSLRQGSLSRQLAQALAAMAPSSLKLTIVEIGDLPLYDPDLDSESPPLQAFERWVLTNAVPAV
jgi:chromate reductase